MYSHDMARNSWCDHHMTVRSCNVLHAMWHPTTQMVLDGLHIRFQCARVHAEVIPGKEGGCTLNNNVLVYYNKYLLGFQF
jgi:hypothetical protein